MSRLVRPLAISIIAGGTVIIVGHACGRLAQSHVQPPRLQPVGDTTLTGPVYRLYTADGCTYIVVGTGSEKWGTHSGTCPNPAHEHKFQ